MRDPHPGGLSTASGRAVHRVWRLGAILSAGAVIAVMAIGPISVSASQRGAAPAKSVGKLQHIVIVMQENRAFDHYFGTYPGANGIPTDGHGNFTVCVPNPKAHMCVKPFHTSDVSNTGGPHAADDFVSDVNNGAMDGFIRTFENCAKCGDRNDVMGYHGSSPSSERQPK